MKTNGEGRGFKPDDVEEPIDRLFHRPLADRCLVRPLLPSRVTPDQLTIASGIASLASGIAIALSARALWLSSAGAALLLFSILLDCADGQLARRRGTSSAAGRILDGVVDAVAPSSVIAAMALLLQARGHDPSWVWPFAVVTGLSLGWHASLYDALKNVYLAGARPDFALGGDPLLSEAELRRMAAEHAARGEHLRAALVQVWLAWTRPQRGWLAPWQAGLRPRDEAERALFVRIFRKKMHAARWIGFGTHLFVLTLGALVVPLGELSLVVAWTLVAGPLSAWSLVVGALWRRGERRFAAAVRAVRDAPAPRAAGASVTPALAGGNPFDDAGPS